MRLGSSSASQSQKASAARKRRWRRRLLLIPVMRCWRRLLLVLVVVLSLSSLGIGVFVGYSYWEYRTFWGDPNAPPPDVTSFGTVETKTFYSESLGQSMEYEIYLPPGYGDLWHRFTHYPVVYLLHGIPGTDDDWVSKGGTANVMDTLLARGQAQPMIVVIPTGANARWGPETGWVDGSQGDWGTYTTQDLVNEIDSNYRTVASADGRAIAGNSEGGWAAANLGLKNPSEFGVIGSFSGYFRARDVDKADLFDGDQSLADANSPLLYLPQLEGKLPAFYLLQEPNEGTHGGRFQEELQEFFEENQEFAKELQDRDDTYKFDNPSSGNHDWPFWREYLPDFFVFVSEHLR